MSGAGYIKGIISISSNLPEWIQTQSPNENELLLLAQQEFIKCTKSVIQSLIKDLSQPRIQNVEESGRCVLILPTLTPWAMCITETLIKECYSSLVYFLVGAGTARRAVICHEDLIQRKVIQDSLMQFETLNVDNPTPSLVNKISSGKLEVKVGECVEETKHRKPDKQLYIPKAQREIQKTEDAKRLVSETQWIGSSLLDLKTISNDNVQPDEDQYWKKLSFEHLHDIYSSVGSVFLMKPDWSGFGVGFDIFTCWDSSVLGHMLELYDFPSSFVESDITNIFLDFKNLGFHIHWTDDTHAVIRFSTQEIAAEALTTIRHPCLKCRPISIASRKTKLMLAKSPEKTLPFKRRPKTESYAAKRLIYSSLGLSPKSPKSK